MLKKLILIFLLTTSLFAIEKKQIQALMTKKINSAIDILKDSKLNTEQKASKIISIMNLVFDYKLMSKLALGRQWKNITKKQKEQFTKLFTKRLKNSYVEKINLYTSQKVKIKKLMQPKRTRIILSTILVGKDDNYDINYKFYTKTNSNNWKIYDINLVGVSIIQTYRKQFSIFLREKSFEQLISYLNNKK